MFKRRTTGSVVCRSCGRLVSVNDKRCFNCGAWNPGLWGFAPLFQKLGHDLGFVQIVTWGCAALYLATLLYSSKPVLGGFGIIAPDTWSVYAFGASGAYPVFEAGGWWTLLSAAWLHGGALHILFNMMWIRQLAPVTANLYGPSRLVIIYTVASITGFFISSLAGTQLTLGASASLFGLFGALVWAGRKTGSSEIGRQALIYAAVIFVFGLLMPGIDNWAHAGGFAGGFAAAYLLNPLQRETFGNLILALVCLAATALSIMASVALA